MENIVFGLQNIHFEEDPEGNSINYKAPIFSMMPSKSLNCDVNIDDEDEPTTSIAATRRSLRQRTPLANSSLSKTNRRTTMKPNRNTTDKRAVDIKKIYLTKSLTKFHPAKLETIFEEPQPDRLQATASAVASNPAAIESSGLVHFIGAKKLRRSLSCSDGLNINKTLIKRRRAKIKRTFGMRCMPKKIALDEFMRRLANSIGDDKPATDNQATGDQTTATAIAEKQSTSAMTIDTTVSVMMDDDDDDDC